MISSSGHLSPRSASPLLTSRPMYSPAVSRSQKLATGCPEFADLSFLENISYMKDDTMYIKGIVDTSKIFHP